MVLRHCASDSRQLIRGLSRDERARRRATSRKAGQSRGVRDRNTRLRGGRTAKRQAGALNPPPTVPPSRRARHPSGRESPRAWPEPGPMNRTGSGPRPSSRSGSRNGAGLDLRPRPCGRIGAALDVRQLRASFASQPLPPLPAGSTRPSASSVASSISASSLSVRARMRVWRATFGIARI
jgi:hypothetical protein